MDREVRKEQIKNILYTEQHNFSVGVAIEISIEAAIIYNHIKYWVVTNERAERNVQEGKAWIYDTREKLAGILPYLTERQIKYHMQKLKDAHLIEVRNDFNTDKWNKTNWYTLGEGAFDGIFYEEKKKIPDGTTSVPSKVQSVSDVINTNKDTNKDIDLSKDKLEETSSSMELDVKPVEKYILPNDNNLYSLFKSYLEKWNSYPGTTSHSLKPIESNQTQIVYNSFSYLLSAINGPVEFLQKYKSELDEKWLEKYNINEESLTSIPKDVLKKVLNNYASGLVKGQKIKEENYILSSRLSEFFMYKTHIRSGQADKAKTISWYLYSCIKLAGKAEKPLERKYPDSYTSIYNKIDKLFGVNRKQLDKTSTALQNDCYRLAEDLIDNITLKKKKLKEEGIRVCRYMASNLYQDFEDFYKTTSFMTDNVRTNPTTFMSNRNSWNNFIDFLRDKYGEPGKDKERYDLFKNNKEQQ